MGWLLRYCEKSDENYERAIKWIGGVTCAGCAFGTILLMVENTFK